MPVTHAVCVSLAVAGTCLLAASGLLARHLRRERRMARALAARLNARITMEQHWASQATDGRTLMMDGEALRASWGR